MKQSKFDRLQSSSVAIEKLLDRVEQIEKQMPVSVKTISLRFYDNGQKPGGAHCHASTTVALRLESSSQ